MHFKKITRPFQARRHRTPIVAFPGSGAYVDEAEEKQEEPLLPRHSGHSPWAPQNPRSAAQALVARSRLCKSLSAMVPLTREVAAFFQGFRRRWNAQSSSFYRSGLHAGTWKASEIRNSLRTRVDFGSSTSRSVHVMFLFGRRPCVLSKFALIFVAAFGSKLFVSSGTLLLFAITRALWL